MLQAQRGHGGAHGDEDLIGSTEEILHVQLLGGVVPSEWLNDARCWEQEDVWSSDSDGDGDGEPSSAPATHGQAHHAGGGGCRAPRRCWRRPEASPAVAMAREAAPLLEGRVMGHEQIWRSPRGAISVEVAPHSSHIGGVCVPRNDSWFFVRLVTYDK